MRRDHRCGGDEGDDCGGGVPAAAPPRGAVLSDVADRAHLPVPHLHVTRRLVDLSHTIEHGMVTYPGLPAPVISDWLSRDASSSRYAPGTTFQIGKIEMLANTGTYIDAPFHRYDGRQDIGDYPLESVADLEGVVIRATERKGRALDAAWFGGHDVRGKAVLVHTGWDAHWRTERYGSGHPFLTRDAVEHLVSAGGAARGVGRAAGRGRGEKSGGGALFKKKKIQSVRNGRGSSKDFGPGLQTVDYLDVRLTCNTRRDFKAIYRVILITKVIALLLCSLCFHT